jgi:hypothetical protein
MMFSKFTLIVARSVVGALPEKAKYALLNDATFSTAPCTIFLLIIFPDATSISIVPFLSLISPAVTVPRSAAIALKVCAFKLSTEI